MTTTPASGVAQELIIPSPNSTGLPHTPSRQSRQKPRRHYSTFRRQSQFGPEEQFSFIWPNHRQISQSTQFPSQ